MLFSSRLRVRNKNQDDDTRRHQIQAATHQHTLNTNTDTTDDERKGARDADTSRALGNFFLLLRVPFRGSFLCTLTCWGLIDGTIAGDCRIGCRGSFFCLLSVVHFCLPFPPLVTYRSSLPPLDNARSISSPCPVVLALGFLL